MTTPKEPWRLANAKREPPPLSLLTVVIKALALVVGGCVTMLVLASVIGLFIETVWLQLVLAAVPAVGLPLLVVDRLLPNDGSARPGLLTDIAALLWMGCAVAAFGLGTTSLRQPLAQAATRFDDRGMTRVGWSMRWIAGVDVAQTQAHVVADGDDASDDTSDETAAPADAETTEPAAGAEFTAAPADKDRQDLRPAEIFKQWAPSVVTIRNVQTFGEGMGTGFIIDSNGTIATNHHVVDEHTRLSVKLFDGTEVNEVELLETNAEADLALIRIRTDQPLQPVVLGSSAAVQVGEPVIVIGNPVGLEHTLTDGIVSSRRLYQGKKYIQMSAPVSPGNSGGPVFNAHGDIVGVTVAKLMGENLNFAVPVDQLKPMIKDEYPNAKALGESRW